MEGAAVSELLPPKNFRQVIPRCCGTCRYLQVEYGCFVCERDTKNVHFEIGDRNDLFAVCDRWGKETSDSQKEQS